jgi:hypothetical protein
MRRLKLALMAELMRSSRARSNPKVKNQRRTMIRGRSGNASFISLCREHRETIQRDEDRLRIGVRVAWPRWPIRLVVGANDSEVAAPLPLVHHASPDCWPLNCVPRWPRVLASTWEAHRNTGENRGTAHLALARAWFFFTFASQ